MVTRTPTVATPRTTLLKRLLQQLYDDGKLSIYWEARGVTFSIDDIKDDPEHGKLRLVVYR